MAFRQQLLMVTRALFDELTHMSHTDTHQDAVPAYGLHDDSQETIQSQGTTMKILLMKLSRMSNQTALTGRGAG